MSTAKGGGNLPTEPDDRREIYYRRNVVACSLADSLWLAAYACMALGTIQPVYLQRLGATKTIIGALPGLQIAAFAFLQLPSVRWTRRLRRKVGVFAGLHFPVALLLIAVGVMVGRWSLTHPDRMTWTFLTVMAIRLAALGIVVPLWGDLLRRLFPDNRRGQAMGIIIGTSSVFGVLGAAYARYILSRFQFPTNFSHLFIIAGIFMTIAAGLYRMAREVVPSEADTSSRQLSYRSVLLAAIKTDQRLRRFIFSCYIYQMGAMVAIFFPVYAIEQFAQPAEIAGTFTLLLMAAAAVGGLVLGRLGDRRGYRRVLAWGIVAMIGATLTALVSPTITLFYAVFIFLGLANSAFGVGLINMLVEMCPHEDKSTYVALFNTAAIPTQIGAPILAGYLGDRLGLGVVLIAAIGMQLAAFVTLLALVDDPRRPGRRVLRWPPRRWLRRLT